jgi:hypothetical protein
MTKTAGAQLVDGFEPIRFRRALGTTPGFPECVGQGGDVTVPECHDAMPNGYRLSRVMGVLEVLQRMPRSLVPGQVFLLSLMLSHTVDMCGLPL